MRIDEKAVERARKVWAERIAVGMVRKKMKTEGIGDEEAQARALMWAMGMAVFYNCDMKDVAENLREIRKTAGEFIRALSRRKRSW